MIYFGFFILPFIQLGINWWIGVPLICLVIILLSLDYENISQIDFSSFGFLCCAIILSTALNSSGDTRELLRAFRELLVFLFIILAISPIEFKNSKLIPQKVIRILCIISSSIFLLTLFQFISIRFGHTISLPESWYPRKLFAPTTLDFNYSHVRPSGTFTEPSYLGLFTFAILTTGVSLKSKYKGANFLIYSSLITIALSQSKSGIVFSILLFLSLIANRLRNQDLDTLKISTVSLSALFLGTALFFFNIARINDSSSIRDRVFIPVRIVSNYFLSHPFGIPYYERLDLPVIQLQTSNWFELSHNGLLNLIFDYGIFGLLILMFIVLALRNQGLLFLLVVYLGIQNGSFLDFDKAVIALYTATFLRNSRCFQKNDS